MFLKFFLATEVTTTILQPQPLSNDPQLIQFIYGYSNTSKHFVEV